MRKLLCSFASEVRQQQGHIGHLSPVSSVENVSRLIAAKTTSNVHFALAREGMDILASLLASSVLTTVFPGSVRDQPRQTRLDRAPVGASGSAICAVGLP